MNDILMLIEAIEVLPFIAISIVIILVAVGSYFLVRLKDDAISAAKASYDAQQVKK